VARPLQSARPSRAALSHREPEFRVIIVVLARIGIDAVSGLD